MLPRLEALLQASGKVKSYQIIDNDPIDEANFLFKIRCELTSGQTLQIRQHQMGRLGRRMIGQHGRQLRMLHLTADLGLAPQECAGQRIEGVFRGEQLDRKVPPVATRPAGRPRPIDARPLPRPHQPRQPPLADHRQSFARRQGPRSVRRGRGRKSSAAAGSGLATGHGNESADGRGGLCGVAQGRGNRRADLRF